MKIVFIGGRDIRLIGGIESYMLNLTRELVRTGHQPIVFCEGDCDRVEYIDGVKVIYQKGFKSNLICKPWLGLKATLKTILHERNVDLIHYNAWPPSLWSFIPRLFGIKTLMQGHGLEWQRSKYSVKQQKILKFMEKLTAHMNEKLIMCSEDQTRYFKETYGKNAVTIPTAVHLPTNEPSDKSTILSRFKIQKEKYILFMSRLVQDKNPDILIKAFKESQVPKDFQLVIAGDNNANPEYIKYLRSLLPDDNSVIMTGAVYNDDKDSLFRNAFAYCLPSTIEGLSISLLEAMSYKLPILASDIPANRELLNNNAVWFPPENEEKLKIAIELIVNNAKSVQSYIENNYSTVTENYTWNIIANKYVDYIRNNIIK